MEFLTELQQSANQMHELFLALLGAGFTEDQAVKLLAAMTMRSDAE